jgi:hypothetical protein
MSRFEKFKAMAPKLRPTVYVRYKAGGNEAYVAEEDFREELHERVDAPPDAPAVATPAAAPPAAADGVEATTASAGDAGEAFDAAGYDGLNAGEVIQLIGTLEDTERVAAVAAYEETNKKRKTVIHAAAARTEELEGTEEDGA